MQFLETSLIELITQTSTNLPPDVRQAMSAAISSEAPKTQSSQALSIIASNIDMAVEDAGPICQDTGMPTFVVHTPVGVNQIKLKGAIEAAVAEATKRGKLRPNSVDSLTGKNSGNNLGEETPVIHFEQWEEDEIEVKLILGGGGCEEQEYSVFSSLLSWNTWAAPTVTLRACAKKHSPRDLAGAGTRRARLAPLACALAATAHTATTPCQKSVVPAPSTTVNPIPELAKSSKPRS